MAHSEPGRSKDSAPRSSVPESSTPSGPVAVLALPVFIDLVLPNQHGRCGQQPYGMFGNHGQLWRISIAERIRQIVKLLHEQPVSCLPDATHSTAGTGTPGRMLRVRSLVRRCHHHDANRSCPGLAHSPFSPPFLVFRGWTAPSAGGGKPTGQGGGVRRESCWRTARRWGLDEVNRNVSCVGYLLA